MSGCDWTPKCPCPYHAQIREWGTKMPPLPQPKKGRVSTMAEVTLSITDNNGEVFSWTASTGTDDEAMLQLAITRVTRHGRHFLEGNASIEQLEAVAALDERRLGMEAWQ